MAASQLENIPWWGKNSLGGWGKRGFGVENILNKINNNSKNYRRAFALGPLSLVAGLTHGCTNHTHINCIKPSAQKQHL